MRALHIVLSFGIATAAWAQSESVLIKGIPHVRQKPDFCGEACVEMYLRKLGHDLTQDDVFNQSRLDPELGRGCYTAELSTALTRLGFKAGTGGAWIPVKTHEKALEDAWQALYDDLTHHTPSIVCMHYSDKPNTTEHFRLILGYDAEKQEVIFNEPAVKNGSSKRMEKSTFLKLWPLKYKKDRWLLIRFPLNVGKIAKVKKTQGHSNADYVQEIIRIRKKMPDGFTLLMQKPFIVVGDEDARTVRMRAKHTIEWATDHLKRDYFSKDPNAIITIWLFKNKKSYRKYTKELFNDKPDTPFGYYSSTHKALIMNIATGGGTLVHEMVHPFMSANFQACPSWFNEGFASLYEQCGEKNDQIMGKTNWRLAGLQRAIRKKGVPSFKTLCSTTTNQFYNADPGTNYSQARYLCYYLQEKGLLRKFYRAFVKNAKTDPTGYKTLKKVLDVDDMQTFRKNWEKWVLKLEFP